MLDFILEMAVKLRNALVSLCLVPFLSVAADNEFALIIKDHHFIPADVKVPSGKKIKLVVDNQDASPEELESHDVNREKVIPGKTKAAIFIGPLKPGKYAFVGEFNEATARGVIIAE
mgnify:CR=1 FL=1|jgi:plastocyanin domain-containing protein